MKKVKIGIVGCGKISQCSHVPALQALGNKKAEIIALYDKDPQRADKLAEEKQLKDVKICRTMKAMVESGVNAVIIATPNQLHYPQTMQCLEAGIHVMVEKPMAASLQQADAMCALAQQKKLVLQVNQSFRFIPLYNRVKKVVDSGEIGVPLHIRCIRAGTKSPNEGWSVGADWFVSKAARGGILMDIAVHMADMICWMFGDVESISAQNSIRRPGGEVIDNSVSLFRFANGATGVLELSWTFPVGVSMVEIYGDKGSAVLAPDSKSFIIRKKDSDKVANIDGESCKVDNSHQWFINAIGGKAGNPASGLVGRNALALLTTIEKSSRFNGKAVKPELKK